MKIAICITTRNRPEAFWQTYKHWIKYKPDNAGIFIVDDASSKMYVNADYRFNERVGIPRVKNKCFELAYKWGAEYIFLSDDDCYPISEDWYKPYINSGLNHLCYTFTSGFNGTASWKEGQKKDNYIIHSLGCGCMMYFTRKCLDIVGGFDETFGLGKYEHPNLSRRIHNAGLTPYIFMDVLDGDKLFYSMDKNNKIERSFTTEEQKQLLKENKDYFFSKIDSKEFIPFISD